MLENLSDTVTLLHKEVTLVGAKLTQRRGTRTVNLRYEIESLPTGSRLRLYNDPNDDTFPLQVRAPLYNRVIAASREGWVTVERYLEALAYLRGQDDRRLYRQGLRELARRVGVLSVKPKVVALRTRPHPKPEPLY